MVIGAAQGSSTSTKQPLLISVAQDFESTKILMTISASRGSSTRTQHVMAISAVHGSPASTKHPMVISATQDPPQETSTIRNKHQALVLCMTRGSGTSTKHSEVLSVAKLIYHV